MRTAKIGPDLRLCDGGREILGCYYFLLVSDHHHVPYRTNRLFSVWKEVVAEMAVVPGGYNTKT